MTQGWSTPLLAAAAVGLLASGCGGEARGTGGEQASTSTPTVQVRTAEVPANPCDWIPSDQVAGLIGPLDGPSERVRSAEQPEPAEHGNGVVLEVSPTAGVLVERAMGAMQQHFAAILGDGRPAPEAATPAAPDEGWDYSGPLPTGLVSYIGRIGHVSVLVVSQSPDVPRLKLAALAARVRDRIPDLPFALPPDPMLEELKRMEGGEPEPPPTGPDPCGLLTRAEAEAVLGKLVVEPYRSSETTPLADPYGNGCAYLAAGHRALVLRPHWDSGKMMFGMARSTGSMLASALPEAGQDGEAADTLEGPWGEAVANGTTGELYFLKGDRMLELGYLTSSTGTDGAVRLARVAVGRL